MDDLQKILLGLLFYDSNAYLCHYHRSCTLQEKLCLRTLQEEALFGLSFLKDTLKPALVWLQKCKLLTLRPCLSPALASLAICSILPSIPSKQRALQLFLFGQLPGGRRGSRVPTSPMAQWAAQLQASLLCHCSS